MLFGYFSFEEGGVWFDPCTPQRVFIVLVQEDKSLAESVFSALLNNK